jgi:hypothetical protein
VSEVVARFSFFDVSKLPQGASLLSFFPGFVSLASRTPIIVISISNHLLLLGLRRALQHSTREVDPMLRQSISFAVVRPGGSISQSLVLWDAPGVGCLYCRKWGSGVLIHCQLADRVVA